MASRAIDLLITYRIVKLLTTPFDKQEAFKFGIIDKDGKVLRKNKTLRLEKERKSYTILHRFVFNLKRILKRVGLGSRLGSFAVALALLIKENKEYSKHKTLIEQTVIKYLKDVNEYDDMLNECREIKETNITNEPFINAFGFDVYEEGEKMVTEDYYAETL
tara:strand:- start:469 stop:954 length:486 start_codon:yes stop_codon:yes gene_type:complete